MLRNDFRFNFVFKIVDFVFTLREHVSIKNKKRSTGTQNGITMVKATLISSAFIRGKFFVLMWHNGRWVFMPLARAIEVDRSQPVPVGIKIRGGVKIIPR